MFELIRQEKMIPVKRRTDVLVAGGGIAGVAAALAAARSGRKVLLCEREFLPGGLATLGMVAIYLPIDDGNGRQVSFGLSEELLRLSVKDGKTAYSYNGVPDRFYPAAWLTPHSREERGNTRFRTQYNPYLYALELEALLLREGVEILYGTLVADARVEKGLITHVILENADGRTAVAVRAAVDATGDAILSRAAGEETVTCGFGNARSFWYTALRGGRPDLIGLSEHMPLPGKPAAQGQKVLYSLDAAEQSRFLIDTHALFRKDVAEKKKTDPSFEPVALPALPDLRMTRRIAGVRPSAEADEGKELSDSVGCFGNWHRADGGFELPFGSLHGSRVKNLFAAGRCSAAEDAMWDLTRVIPVCAVTGEAAGVAAALTALERADLRDVQNELRSRGVKLHLKDCGVDF